MQRLVRQREEIEKTVAEGSSEWSTVRPILARLHRNLDALRIEERDHLRDEARKNGLRGCSREKWESFELGEKKALLSRIFDRVIVMPVPPGRSDKAPFDPGLLTVVWQRDLESRPHSESPE